jgi:hypothetical protein
VLPRVCWGTFSQLIFGSELDFVAHYLPERPGNCVNEILDVISYGPNGTDPVAPHQKSFSHVLVRPHVSDTACARSNALCVVCEKTQRSYVMVVI